VARAVGLDIGNRLLKLVELTGSAKAPKVVRVVVRSRPPGTGPEVDEAVSALVADLFAQTRLPKDDVCVSFDTGTTILREITVPFHDDDQIAKVVRFEAENHLHGRAIEDVVVNWVKTGTTREGSQLLVFASPKAELSRRLDVLAAAGIQPASVDLDATALYTACHAAGVFRDHPNVVVVEVGARTTNLLVVDGGALRLVRSFLAGAEGVGTALQSDLEHLPPGEAAARALRAPGPDPAALLVPASEALPAAAGGAASKSLSSLEGEAAESRRVDFAKKVQRELARSLAGSRGKTPPERILVAGGGSLLPGLRESLAEHFGLPVEPLDILGRLGSRAEPEEPETSPELLSAVAAVPIGCAARLLGIDPLGVELRQDEFAPKNTFDVVKTPLAVAVSLLFCVLLVMAFVTKKQTESENAAFRQVVARARSIFHEAERKYHQHVLSKDEGAARQAADAEARKIPDDENALRAILGRLQQRHRRLEGDLGLSKDIPRIQSALEVWVELYDAMGTIDRKSIGWLRINKLTVLQTSATMTVEVDDPGVLDRIESALSQSEYLRGRAKNPARPVTRGSISTGRNSPRTQATFEFQFGEERL
jgi:type IV pilus assembly protein PilM